MYDATWPFVFDTPGMPTITAAWQTITSPITNQNTSPTSQFTTDLTQRLPIDSVLTSKRQVLRTIDSKFPKPQTRLWSNLNPTRHFIYINLKLGTPLIWSSTQKFQTRSIHCGRVSQGSQNFQESTYKKSSLYNDTTYSQTMHHIYKRCTLLQFCR